MLLDEGDATEVACGIFYSDHTAYEPRFEQTAALQAARQLARALPR